MAWLPEAWRHQANSNRVEISVNQKFIIKIMFRNNLSSNQKRKSREMPFVRGCGDRYKPAVALRELAWRIQVESIIKE